MKPSRVVRAYESYDVDERSERTALVCLDPSRAIQSQAEEADINTIVRNFGLTGKIPVGVRTPTYGDFDQVDDYRTAVEQVRAAEASFLAMPAEVRSRFGNDPQLFVEFCSDRGNLEELRKLGLALPVAVSSDSSGGTAS